MYDLTTLLTTIAAISATVLAILGGFIFSNHISVASQFSKVNNRKNGIIKEIDSKQQEIKKQIERCSGFDALIFIYRNHDRLIIDGNFVDFDSEGNLPGIDREEYEAQNSEFIWNELQLFWEKAKRICDEYHNHPNELERTNNEYRIPDVIYNEFKDDEPSLYFCYEYDRTLQYQIYKNCEPPKYDPIGNIIRYDEYSKKCRAKIKELDSEIASLKKKLKSLDDKKEHLVKPRGVVPGLIIFFMVLLFCVVAPVVHTLCTIESQQTYNTLKIASLICFGVGLLAIFCYLVYLVRFTKEEKRRWIQPDIEDENIAVILEAIIKDNLHDGTSD